MRSPFTTKEVKMQEDELRSAMSDVCERPSSFLTSDVLSVLLLTSLCAICALSAYRSSKDIRVSGLANVMSSPGDTKQ